MNRLESLAVGKACYVRLYSNSKLKNREPWIALSSHQGWGGGGFISASAVTYCGTRHKAVVWGVVNKNKKTEEKNPKTESN